MKLKNYLYESLLDDEDVLVSSGDEDALKAMYTGADSPVQQIFRHEGMNGASNIPPYIEENKIIFQNFLYITDHKPVKSITDLLPGIDHILTNRINISRKIDVLDGNKYCNNFSTNFINIDGLRKLSNVNIFFIPDSSTDKLYNRLHSYGAVFDNVTITDNYHKTNLMFFKNPPKFINTKFNCKYNAKISISLPEFGSKNDILTKTIDKLLDANYKCISYDHKKGEENIRKCNLNNIKILISDLKYELKTKLFRFKSDVKIEDVLGTTIPDAIDEININAYDWQLKFFRNKKILPDTLISDAINGWVVAAVPRVRKNRQLEKLHRNPINYDPFKIGYDL